MSDAVETEHRSDYMYDEPHYPFSETFRESSTCRLRVPVCFSYNPVRLKNLKNRKNY